MLIAPLSWSVLPAATLLTDERAAEMGGPLANLVDADPLKVCRFRGASLVITGTNDKVYSSAGNATLTAGWYYSPAELIAHVVAQLNTAAGGVPWSGGLLRSTGQVVLAHATGATIGVGVQNAAVALLGFAAVARASATSHTSDYAAAGSVYRVVWDLGSAQLVEAVFIAGIGMSPAGAIQCGLGSTSAATSVTWTAPEAFEDECLYVPPSAPGIYRYVRADFLDPRRGDGGRTEIGYVYAGRVLDTDRENEYYRTTWEKGSWSHQLEVTCEWNRGKKGQLNVEGTDPGRVISVSWDSSPGIDASALPGVRGCLDGLGSSGLAFVALDPTVGSSAREVYLVRFRGPRSYPIGNISNRGPRTRLSLEFEPLDVGLGF